MNFTGKRALVLGFAREGESLVRFLADAGAAVTVTDAAPRDRFAGAMARIADRAQYHLGSDFPELVADADLFFVSPGVPESNPVYRAAVNAGLPVGSMTTLFFELCPAPILGVTGSSGKTTTTALIGHILRWANRDVLVGGNIGDPMLDLLPRISTESTVVLELSSFQLELLGRSPHIAVITNISPNHLDRHPSMEAYVAAKRAITAHQSAGDHVVLNAGDPAMESFAQSTPAERHWFGVGADFRRGAALLDGTLGLLDQGAWTPIMPTAEIPLLGAHNRENVLAACAATGILDVEPAQMAAAVRSFQPPAHRLQVVAEVNGVQYVDDSIATTPARACVALRAIDSPIVLIAGGRDKRLPWDDFARDVAERARALLLIGEAAADIERAVRGALTPGTTLLPECIIRCDSLAGAVDTAGRLASSGDVILLSPACTSYDMFSDYVERGSAFARAVEALHAA